MDESGHKPIRAQIFRVNLILIAATLVLAMGTTLYLTLSQNRQAIILYIATNGLLDDVPLEQVGSFISGFVDEMEALHADTVEEIQRSGSLSGVAIETIRAAFDPYKEQVSGTWQA